MKKIISKRILLLILISVSIGMYICYHFFIKPKTAQTNSLKTAEKIAKNTISSEALINKIQDKQELITMEVTLSDDILIDHSWGDLEIFKKITTINFKGSGIYTVDLSKINGENISINDSSNTLYIKVPKPIVKFVNLDENKTTYKTEKGLLRFGEIKLTSEENQIITKKVKEKMLVKLKEIETYKKAEYNTEKAIKDLIDTILQNEYKTDYTVIVYLI